MNRPISSVNTQPLFVLSNIDTILDPLKKVLTDSHSIMISNLNRYRLEQKKFFIWRLSLTTIDYINQTPTYKTNFTLNLNTGLLSSKGLFKTKGSFQLFTHAFSKVLSEVKKKEHIILEEKRINNEPF